MTQRRQDRCSLFLLSLTVPSADEQARASPVWQQREGGDNKEHAVRSCLQYLITKETCSTKWFSPAGGLWNAEVSASRMLFFSLLCKSDVRYTQRHTGTQQKTVGHGLVMKSAKKQNALSFVGALSRNLLYLSQKRNSIAKMHQPRGNAKETTNHFHF